MKKILITGAGSYIGTSVEAWLASEKFEGRYAVDVADMTDDAWKQMEFAKYDAVCHVAGIAHADTSSISKTEQQRYYDVNCGLAVATAKKAKTEGTRQFIYMSSLSVYGDSGERTRKAGIFISEGTKPGHSNCYGDSKRQAEIKLGKLAGPTFRVALIRAPMIYGRGCRGNYNRLVEVALKTRFFPDVRNQRSVLYIGNLCEFIRLLVESGEGGVFWPQNKEWVRTSDLVRAIAEAHGRKVLITPTLNWGVRLLGYAPGRIGGMVNKAFGSLAVDKRISKAFDGSYQVYGFKETIQMTESH